MSFATKHEFIHFPDFSLARCHDGESMGSFTTGKNHTRRQGHELKVLPAIDTCESRMLGASFAQLRRDRDIAYVMWCNSADACRCRRFGPVLFNIRSPTSLRFRLQPPQTVRLFHFNTTGLRSRWPACEYSTNCRLNSSSKWPHVASWARPISCACPKRAKVRSASFLGNEKCNVLMCELRSLPDFVGRLCMASTGVAPIGSRVPPNLG